ncbi:MAG: WG repeat-containing protein, partial [Defluviitaleaceae bacterium]|nr:WG repeat-containing protein [Defluviitaleaceae bacterium]
MKSKSIFFGIIVLIAAIVLITIVSASSSEPLTAYVAQFGVFVNGEEKVFENPIVTIDNRTYIPLREIGGVLGIDVEWDGENRKIIINSPQMPIAHDKESDMLYESKQNANRNEEDTLYAFEQDGLWGYKDESGNVVIEPQFISNRNFSEGLAFVSDGAEKRGYIDTSGKLVIPLPTGYFPSDFSQGFARIVMREWDWDNERGYNRMHREVRGPQGPFIFIDRTGKNVFGMEFANAYPFEENGLANVTIHDGYRAFIDRQGNIKYEYKHYYRINGFLKIVMHDGTNVYIDRQGNIV